MVKKMFQMITRQINRITELPATWSEQRRLNKVAVSQDLHSVSRASHNQWVKNEITVAIIEDNAILSYLISQNIKSYAAAIRSEGRSLQIFIEIYDDERDFRENAVGIPDIIMYAHEDAEGIFKDLTQVKNILMNAQHELIYPTNDAKVDFGQSICHQIEQQFMEIQATDDESIDRVLACIKEIIGDNKVY